MIIVIGVVALISFTAFVSMFIVQALYWHEKICLTDKAFRILTVFTFACGLLAGNMCAKLFEYLVTTS